MSGWLVVGFFVGWIVLGRLENWGRAKNAARTAAMYRRIGWAYGYGAGWVDCRRNLACDPTPPPDGMARWGRSPMPSDASPFPTFHLFGGTDRQTRPPCVEHRWDDGDSMNQCGFYFLCLDCGAQEWT